jgi:hypothetical protein
MTWGLVPAATDDVLLDQAGRRLGMPPLIGGPRAITVRERAIFGYYLRQAWEAAPVERRETVLRYALTAWDNATLPKPDVPANLAECADLSLVLESLLQHSTGCRAIACAVEAAPLPLPVPAAQIGPMRVAVARAPAGHQALYSVLLALWRARARLLRDRRTQRQELERQLRQLDTMVAIRRRNVGDAPSSWALQPASGLSVAAAAAVSVGVNVALAAATPVILVPAACVGAAGLAWSAAAALLRNSSVVDSRITQMQSQQQTLRYQLTLVEREILALETE